MEMDAELTARTRDRNDRVAGIYDRSDGLIERLLYTPWRKQLWEGVRGSEVLEVGVGIGKNMPHYPGDARVTAIDLSEEMLTVARRRAKVMGLDVDLRQMDAQELAFPSHTFDTAVATFVFCSVTDAVTGLRELGRVCKPDGEIRLLEHMRARNEVVGWLMDVANPLTVRTLGTTINRRTIENVAEAGLQIERVEDLCIQGIFRLIVAKPAQ